MKFHGYNVRFLPDKQMGGYEGMNNSAAHALGFKPVPPKKTVYIDNIYKGRTRREVIRHEVKEACLMAHGWHYWPAHRHAEKAEKRKRF